MTDIPPRACSLVYSNSTIVAVDLRALPDAQPTRAIPDYNTGPTNPIQGISIQLGQVFTCSTSEGFYFQVDMAYSGGTVEDRISLASTEAQLRHHTNGSQHEYGHTALYLPLPKSALSGDSNDISLSFLF